MVWVIVTSGIIVAGLVAALVWQAKKVSALEYQRLLLIKNLEYYTRREERAAENARLNAEIRKRAEEMERNIDWDGLYDRIRKLTSDGDN